MKLKGRLKMIAEKIPECEILTDIGTDHAYIPIYAAEKNICRKALAVDLRAGPLKMANVNISRHGLEEKIETRIGSGLEPVLPEETDIVVISGMGGNLIKDILFNSAEKARKAKLLLLQPNNAPDALRKWLYENGYTIVEESLAEDAGKIYCLIMARWTGSAEKKDEFAYYAGEKLFDGKDDLLRKYLGKKLKELDVIIEGRRRSDPDKERNASAAPEMDTATCIGIRNRICDYLKEEF